MVGSVNLACPPLLPLQCLLYTARFCDGLGRPVQLAADIPCGLFHIQSEDEGSGGGSGDGWDTPGWRCGSELSLLVTLYVTYCSD